MGEGKIEYSGKLDVMFDCFTFFCMSIHTLYDVVPTFISFLNFIHLYMKWWTSRK
jgi:hypothetical protein